MTSSSRRRINQWEWSPSKKHLCQELIKASRSNFSQLRVRRVCFGNFMLQVSMATSLFPNRWCLFFVEAGMDREARAGGIYGWHHFLCRHIPDLWITGFWLAVYTRTYLPAYRWQLIVKLWTNKTTSDQTIDDWLSAEKKRDVLTHIGSMWNSRFSGSDKQHGDFLVVYNSKQSYLVLVIGPL